MHKAIPRMTVDEVVEMLTPQHETAVAKLCPYVYGDVPFSVDNQSSLAGLAVQAR